MLTQLSPEEDYKTSVLSGLAPEIIMECAGRALSFWSYQLTQDLFVTQPDARLHGRDVLMLTSITSQSLGGSPLQSSG